jgi:hypothetical protein
MLRSSLLLTVVVILTGCPAGSGEIGTTCGNNGDCSSALQCLENRCQPRCKRAPDCGDGYACDQDGLCHQATARAGDTCQSETDCGAGLSCQPADSADSSQHLVGNCTKEISAALAGSTCTTNHDCRNGTCALGHCVDLCQQELDCAAGSTCWDIPSVTVSNALFKGCLPASGVISWDIPVSPTNPEVLIPAPTGARSVALVMSVSDASQIVGATSVLAPDGSRIYSRPCSAQFGECAADDETNAFFANAERHTPAPGQSVLSIPSGTNLDVKTGLYRVKVATRLADGTPSASPIKTTAVIRLDDGVQLDLHFFFLDLSDHPCQATIGPATLNAGNAQASTSLFQGDFLGELRKLFSPAQIAISPASYLDILDHPALDGLDISHVGDLLKLGSFATGINVFFVRSLAPAGVLAYAPNPGPAGIAGTQGSGIVIGLDSLCYRDWSQIARLTAHELARYMGLYHNIELEFGNHPTWRDQINTDDDAGGDPTDNLMYYAEPLDANHDLPVISSGQRQILVRSAVLRSQAAP